MSRLECATAIACLALFVLIVLLTASCTTVRPASVQVCLPLKAYSVDQNLKLAAALGNLAPDSPLIGLTADYQAMRDADRACLAAKP